MAFVMTRGAAATLLQDKYHFEKWQAVRILDITQEFGRKAEPCAGGFVHVVYQGWSQDWPFTERFKVYDHTGENPRPEKVAQPGPMDYTRITDVDTPKPSRKEHAMPTKGRRAAEAPVEQEEQAEVEEAGEFDRHLTKDLTPTMSDFADWYHTNVADIDEMGRTDPARLLAHGSTLYPKFQKSDLNQQNREARRAERAAANGDEEEEVEPAKPTKGRGRPAAAATPAPAAPARAARGAAKPAAAAAAPARPRGRKPAAEPAY